MVPYFRCFTSSKCGRTRLFRNQTLSMERNWSVEQRNSTIWVTEPQLVTVFRIECPCVDRKPVWISLSWKICGVNVTSNGWQCYIHNTNTSTHQVSLESWRRKKNNEREGGEKREKFVQFITYDNFSVLHLHAIRYPPGPCGLHNTWLVKPK